MLAKQCRQIKLVRDIEQYFREKKGKEINERWKEKLQIRNKEGVK